MVCMVNLPLMDRPVYANNDLMVSMHSLSVHFYHRLLITLKYLNFHQFPVKAMKNKIEVTENCKPKKRRNKNSVQK